MPNRILRDWTDSEAVNGLSVHAERLFVRLIMKADDYGRFVASPRLLRPMLFPLTLEQVREADLQRWIAECERAGLVRLYGTEAKPLLEIVRFNQRTRFAPKHPGPDECESGERQAADGLETVDRPLETEAYSEAKAQKKEKTPLPPAPLALPFSSDRFAAVWRSFVEYRREIGKKLTDRSEGMSLKKLAELPEDAAVRCIEDSIANGWQGLFPEKHKASGQSGKRFPTKGEAIDQYVARQGALALGSGEEIPL